MKLSGYLLLVLLMLSVQTNAALTDNLLVRLQLDEGSGTDAADEVGTYTCTLDATSWTASIGGRGPVYTSTETNEINCGAVSIDVGANHTFAFWQYKTGEPNGNNYIITKYNTVTDGRSFRVNGNSSNDISYQISDDGALNEVQITTGVPPITDNDWDHVIVTFAAGVFDVYVDNTLITDDGDFVMVDVFDSTTNSTFCIGNFQCGSDSGFVGHLSELAIWDRVISSAERTAIFNDNWDGGVVPITVDHARRRTQ